jgi:hypothetical protein
MRRSFLLPLVPAVVFFSGACGSDANPSAAPAPAHPAAPASTATRGTASTGASTPTTPSDSGGVTPRDAADDASTDSPPSGPPAVQFLGRFDTRDPAGPKASWPGVRIVARFHGTTASVKMNEIDYAWQEGGPSEWDVTIDGNLRPKVVMQAGIHDYALASDLMDGDHTIELFKRSEAQNGITQFLGFDFGGGALLAPPGRKIRKLELIGDSQFAALGIEGVMGRGNDCDGPDWAARWQNFHASVGADLAKELGAELNGTVYSGKGLYKNIWRPDLETMPQLFLRADPLDPKSAWDFSQYAPGAVLIMIGGMDFAIGQPTDEGGPSTLDQFTDTYEAFVKTIREKYMDAHIFLIVSPSVSDATPAGRNSRTNEMAGVHTTVERRHAAGDERVYEVIPPVATADELVACDGHGTPAFHQRLADQLAPLVRTATGWK